MEKAIYGFSGDPITYGHIDIIKRAVSIFGELIVGIGNNPTKKYFFTFEERKMIAEQSLKFLPNVKVIAFKGLLVDYAYENNIKTVIRGIRNSEDLNYELMLHQIGESQKHDIDTIYFPANQELVHVSSGAAKALQLEQGLIHDYVPLYAKQKLEEKLSGQYIVSITGEIGVGKSYVCKKLQEVGDSNNINVNIIDVDKIGHQILGELNEPLYIKTRNKIADSFGRKLIDSKGFINRQELGKIIFNEKGKLKEFNRIIYEPLLLKLRRQLYGKKGLFILDSALISESGMNYLSNNNIILVNSDNDIQLKRLINRGYNDSQIKSRLNSQYNADLKRDSIIDHIKIDYHGKLWNLENTNEGNDEQIERLFKKIINHFSLIN